MKYWCGEMENKTKVHSVYLCDLLSHRIQELESKAVVFDEIVKLGGTATLVLGMFVDGNLGFEFLPIHISTFAKLNLGFICEVYPPSTKTEISTALTH